MHPTQLSQAQHRLWLLGQLFPERALVNLSMALRLRGKLDFEALSWTIREIGRRHDALRSEILVHGDEPYQVVKSLELGLCAEDYSKLPEPERSRMIEKRVDRELCRPFDHSRAPLIRFFLLREADDQHLLLTVVSHVVFDRFSFDILRRELSELYAARVQRRAPAPAPAAQARFADFARRQAPERERRVQAENLEYWRERLHAIPPSLDLPGDRVRREPSFTAERTRLVLTAGDSEALRALAIASGAGLEALGLAALEVTLARYSAQSDFVVGVLTQARDADSSAVIGMFEDYMAQRAELLAAHDFDELLLRVREGLSQGLAHRELPLQELAQLLARARDPTKNPLFQLTFACLDAHSDTRAMGSLELELVPTFTGAGGLSDLSCVLRDEGGLLSLELDTTRDLYDAETGARLCRSWRRVLQAVAQGRPRALAELPVIAAEDERHLL
ncbi:MAG TPA: condensation domain-containing protein, partial [Polyangiaceae bacterium]|nr:condensation domain-containing protein [Polyangiaceae bacterium]